MSSFITRLPIDVLAFKKLLPNGSDFEGISFNASTNEVELRWSNRYIVTPFTYHEDFTVDMLKSKTLPKTAKLRADAVKVLNPEPAATVEQLPDSAPTVIRDLDDNDFVKRASERDATQNPVDKKRRRGVKKASDAVSDIS